MSHAIRSDRFQLLLAWHKFFFSASFSFNNGDQVTFALLIASFFQLVFRPHQTHFYAVAYKHFANH